MIVLSSPLIILMIIKHSSVIVMIMPDIFSLIGLHFCGWVKSFCGALVSVSLQKGSRMCTNQRMNDGFTKLSVCFSYSKLKNVTVSSSKHSLCSHGNKLISDICPLL